MRLQNCPHCGAENSDRRTTCFQCQQPLAPRASDDGPRPKARSRWEAIEPLRNAPEARPLRPASDAVSSPVRAAPAGGGGSPRSYMPPVRSAVGHVRRMGQFFRQLHALAHSGITVGAACRELSRRAPSSLRGVAAEMASAAEAGKPISSVMAIHHNLFYPWHIGMVRAAESGGFLPEALEQIAHGYEVEWETRSAFRLRLFFYVFLCLPAVLLSLPAILMLTEPIPPQGWDISLALQSIGRYFRTVSIPFAVGLVALFLLWQILGSTAWFQAVQQRLVLRLPVVGRLARASALDRYLATLGLMLRGGLPLAQAAEEAAFAAGSVGLSPKLLAIVPSVRDGMPLTRALAETRVIDPDTLNLAATGEVSGDLPDMLVRAAGHYRAETESKRRMLLRIVQVVFGVVWLCAAAALVLWGMRVYFDFAFRVEDWMWEGIGR